MMKRRTGIVLKAIQQQALQHHNQFRQRIVSIALALFRIEPLYSPVERSQHGLPQRHNLDIGAQLTRFLRFA